MKNSLKLVLLLISFCISTMAISATVSESKAKIVASNFLQKMDSRIITSSLSLVYTSDVCDNQSLLYIFGYADGFVIISGDDRTIPILGYSTEGRAFILPERATETDFGNNFWGMITTYEQQIASVIEDNLSATPAITAQWNTLITPSKSLLTTTTTAVSPLLTTTWNQTWPYNAMCPSGTVVGCVGVAMGQIMAYHDYPSQGLGAYGYQWGTSPYTGANFGTTTYNFPIMPNSISTMTTPADSAVAQILYHAALSCRAMWGSSTGVGYSSNEDPMTRSFVNYFKYAFSTISYIQSSGYTSTTWDSIIQNELINNRPVYYRGDGSLSHAWVCDGVDVNNLYHFNWGWGGSYNGYFALTNLNPGSNTVTNNQAAIIGIKPNDGSTLVTNTTWSGTITKTTSIAVPDAITLTVSPGAVVKFAQNSRLQVFGQLTSIGTASSYTKLTAVDTTTGWLGILWDNSYMNFEVMADNDTSKLIYTQVEWSKSSGISSAAYGKIIIDHCKINNNTGFNGGGICINNNSITVSYSEIYNNHATNAGGGLYLNADGEVIHIYNNTISNNISDIKAGGFYLLAFVDITFKKNIISNNEAITGAGGALGGGSPTLIDNIFCNNITSSYGYGILYLQNCSAKIVQNSIINNTGTGIYCDNGTNPLIINTTIANNSFGYTSGMIFDVSSNAHLKNCIIYGNYATNTTYGNQISIWDNNSDPYFDHCDIQGGLSGIGGPGAGTNYTSANYTNNIDSSPLFVAPSTGTGASYNGVTANWALSSLSPCINTGDTVGISSLLPLLDFGGNPRITGTIDMGAYEYIGVVPVPVSITIVASTNNICAGTSVIFTATPVNGGTTPSYQWKKNNVSVGTNSPTYTTTPSDGDSIICILTSNLTGTSGNPATSNVITMSVNPILPVSVNIVASVNNICAGTSVTFTATPINAGTSPSYQWKVNGNTVGANLPSYSYVPVNGDIVTCVLNSSAVCTSGNPAISNVITMSVNPILPVSVSIVASSNNICAGTSVTFTATPVNAGTSPSYQWKVNGNTVGANLPSYSYVPVNGDIVTCVLNSSAVCTSGNPAISNVITMSVNPLPSVPLIPLGPDSVDLKIVTTTLYTTTSVSSANSYVWEITPSNAGVISGTDTIGTVVWNTSYLGIASIRVKAVNTCGASVWSANKQTLLRNTTGIEDYTIATLYLYPNPTTGTFFISSSDPLSKVIIFDNLGKLIDEIDHPESNHTYNYNHLPIGMYYIHITSRDMVIIKKMIITSH